MAGDGTMNSLMLSLARNAVRLISHRLVSAFSIQHADTVNVYTTGAADPLQDGSQHGG